MKFLCSAASLIGLAATAFACSTPNAENEDENQIVSGQVAMDNFDSKVVGVRAVRGVDVVALATIDKSTGSFSIELPVADRLRLEVVTASGAHPFSTLGDDSANTTFFDVCSPGAPFDVGHVHRWDDDVAEANDDGDPEPCEDPTDPNCGDPEPCEDPTDPNCGDPEPCEDPTDPNCCPDGDCGDPEPCEDPTDPNCGEPKPCEDPADPNCCPDGDCGDPGDPEPCEDPTDPNCGEPEPCEDPADPNCCPDGDCGDPGDPEPCEDPTDPNCGEPEPCEDPADPNCGEPEPCEDPADPNCCPEPGPDGSCWPEPVCESEPNGPSNDSGDEPTEPDECWEDDGAVCEYALLSFGCEASN